MHFDDRLATVLRHRAIGERAARTQFRQLLDLLGSERGGHGGRDPNLLAAAWLRIGALGEAIPSAERARMIAEPGMRFRNPELAAHLAEDEPEVAAVALSRAELSEGDWEALIPRLPVRARGFLRLRRGLPHGTQDLLERLGIHDRGLPQPEDSATETDDAPRSHRPRPTVVPHPANDFPAGIGTAHPRAEDSAIGALVRRIEAFRKSRTDAPEPGDAPRLPLGESANDDQRAPLQGFAFTCDTQGRIDWAAKPAAAATIGMKLDQSQIRATLQFQQPIRKLRVTLAGAPLIAGDWIVDATPRFTRPDGRFFGYAGMFRRLPDARANDTAGEQSSEADQLRQQLHELRTPVNAIQGFSEVIQQQLFGPTPHEYRALAATIASDSARMLAGFDELDRLAQLETGSLDIEAGQSDFAAIVGRQVEQLQSVLKPRSAGFEPNLAGSVSIPIRSEEAEGLAWRLLATLAAATGADEHLALDLSGQDGALNLLCDLPEGLSTKEDIFAATGKPASSAVSAGMFGAGFALRLARAEARAAGGELARVADRLALTLPLLTDAGSEPSDEDARNAG